MIKPVLKVVWVEPEPPASIGLLFEVARSRFSLRSEQPARGNAFFNHFNLRVDPVVLDWLLPEDPFQLGSPNTLDCSDTLALTSR